MPGPFADEQLAAYMRQQPPAFAALDVAAMREGIVHGLGSTTQARDAPGSGPALARWAPVLDQLDGLLLEAKAP
ncbi:MAG: hypothetical protein M3Z97_02690 [Candidatus Dormibacteraeota bacterium]|nr:hypothetical protein [Candidatus Dormibacteraeota bacterium]